MTHDLETDLFDDVARTMTRTYDERLKETLRRAVRNGYDGVDIVHDEVEFLFKGPRTSAWRAKKWRDEPPATDGGNREWYDFRYYDRESLLYALEHEEWPDGGEDEP